MSEYIGKHAKIDLIVIKKANSGACFHGEVWVRCPYCGRGHQIVGLKPVARKDEYDIFKCSCGELFKF